MVHMQLTWSSPKWPRLTRGCDIWEIDSIRLNRLKVSTRKHVRPKKFPSDSTSFRPIWGRMCGNPISSQMQYQRKGSKVCRVLLPNSAYFWSFLMISLVWRYRVATHSWLFFPEVAKLLRAAAFLNSAATYGTYVVVVPKMPTRGATTRLAF